MKVILLKDIKGTGKKGDVIDASDGHARNYLLPRKLAVEASKSNMNELEHKNIAQQRARQAEMEEAQRQAKILESKTLDFKIKLGPNGKLFGSLTNKEIAAELSKQFGFDVDKNKIEIEEHIKYVGDHTVTVRLYPQITAKLKIKVEAE